MTYDYQILSKHYKTDQTIDLTVKYWLKGECSCTGTQTTFNFNREPQHDNISYEIVKEVDEKKELEELRKEKEQISKIIFN